MNTKRAPTPYQVIIGLTAGRLSGVDVFSVHLTRALCQRGIPARILLTQHDCLPPDPLPLPADVPCDRLDLGRGRSLAARLRTLIDQLSAYGRCVYIPNYDYDHSWACVKLPSHVAVVGILHSDDPLHYAHAARLGKYWNSVVAVSRHIAETIERTNADVANRVRVIPYGVPVPEMKAPQVLGPGEPLRVLYVGRMEPVQKRPRDVIRVAAATLARGVPLRLTMIGGGPGLEEVTRFAATHLPPGSYHFPGILSNEDVLGEYAQHDAFLLTSSFEGLPVSMLEAMARGCVPVVSRIPSGVPDVLRDGRNGWTAPVGAIDQFAERLQWLYADPERRHQMGVAARDTILHKGFCLDDMVDRYVRLFGQVVEEAGSNQFVRPLGELPSPPASSFLPYRVWRAGRNRLGRLARRGRQIAGKVRDRILTPIARLPVRIPRVDEP